MAKERVAVIGGGGREHAILSSYLRSDHVESGMAIPGNDMMKIGQRKPVETFPNVKATDTERIIGICKDRRATFVDVAQDNAIRDGLVDRLEQEGIGVFGPTAAAGQIEWSKAFAREMLDRRTKFLQPEFRVFCSKEDGISFLQSQREEGSWFVKADGLCAGKGALPAKTNTEAMERIKEVWEFKNNAGKIYLLERWLKNSDGSNGEEASSFCISDGKIAKMLGHAQDYKRENNRDEGLNTGSMGSNAPTLAMTDDLKGQSEQILSITIDLLGRIGRPYKGILYLGGIIIRKSEQTGLYIIEFNARWGDPEAQVIVPGIKNDFFELCSQAAGGDISKVSLLNDGKARVVVTGASKGYPGNHESVLGKRIVGLEGAMKVEGVRVYGAGVKVIDGKYYADGGRLFYIVGEGSNVYEAKYKADLAMMHIDPYRTVIHARSDIAWRDLEKYLKIQQAKQL